ncbi:MAG: AAA family ATPase [Planctomycetia bacterium]|nr:AAA family ATPase [Planctomycetia bacterium]
MALPPAPQKSTPPPPPPRKAPPKAKAQPAAPTKASRTPKSFKVGSWTGEGEGHKVVLYGASGRGKTTLASLLPNPVFIGADDGGRKIRHAGTGEPLPFIEGVENFDDLRDALASPGLFDNYSDVVIDSITAVEVWAADWTCENIAHEKGHKVARLVDYGYCKGYEHLYDTMRLVQQSLDPLCRSGKNVVLLAQQAAVVIANAGGTNYLEDGPKLYHPGPDSKQTFSCRQSLCEWADHVFRIDFNNRTVDADKKAKGDTTRAVFITPENPSYFVKSRTLGNMKDEAGDPITRVSFADPSDDTLWRFLLPEKYNG